MKLLPEDKFIINCSRVSISNPLDREICRAVTERAINWEMVYKNAYRHKVVPLIYCHLKRLKLLSYINIEVRGKFEAVYRENKLKNGVYLRESLMLLDAFGNQGIKAVLTKGAYLVQFVYEDPALRYFVDVDILVGKTDFTRACSIMQESGYTIGKYNKDEGKIFEMSKGEKLFWHKFLGHLPFSKMSKSKYCEAINIEVHFDFFMEACRGGLTDDLINNTNVIIVKNRSLPCLNEVNLIIHQCCDLFKDIYDMKKIKDNSNLRMSKFCDVFEIINIYKAKIDWEVFIKTVDNNRLRLPVYLCFSHINLLYDEVIPQGLLKRLMPGYEDLTGEFKSIHIEGDVMDFFNENMIYCLFNNNKRGIIERLAGIRAANFKRRVDSYRNNIRKFLSRDAKN